MGKKERGPSYSYSPEPRVSGAVPPEKNIWNFASRDDIKVVKKLIKDDAMPPDGRNKLNQTPLHTAAAHNAPRVVAYLVGFHNKVIQTEEDDARAVSKKQKRQEDRNHLSKAQKKQKRLEEEENENNNKDSYEFSTKNSRRGGVSTGKKGRNKRLTRDAAFSDEEEAAADHVVDAYTLTKKANRKKGYDKVLAPQTAGELHTTHFPFAFDEGSTTDEDGDEEDIRERRRQAATDYGDIYNAMPEDEDEELNTTLAAEDNFLNDVEEQILRAQSPLNAGSLLKRTKFQEGYEDDSDGPRGDNPSPASSSGSFVFLENAPDEIITGEEDESGSGLDPYDPTGDVFQPEETERLRNNGRFGHTRYNILDTRCAAGRTPLMEAAKQNHYGICKALLKAGATATMRDAQGLNAFDHCTSASLKEVLAAAVAQQENQNNSGKFRGKERKSRKGVLTLVAAV